MRHCLMIFSVLLIASCGEKLPQVRLIAPEIPGDLRQPVKVPEREVGTLADVGLVLTDHVEALDAANGKITAIDCILRDAEKQTGQDVMLCPEGEAK